MNSLSERISGNDKSVDMQSSLHEGSSRVGAVILRNLLSEDTLNGLRDHILQNQHNFIASTVFLTSSLDKTTELSVDHQYRKSRILNDLGPYWSVFEDAIRSALPNVLRHLNEEQFPISRIEMQVTASNDGDYFTRHRDSGPVSKGRVNLRELSFVYYFFFEPKEFSGGELKIYDITTPDVEFGTEAPFELISPNQNRIVFFPSWLDHEVLPVRCKSAEFKSSRFTVNGWIYTRKSRGPVQGVRDRARNPALIPNDYVEPIPRIYLTLSEASNLSGLSKAYLMRLIQTRKLEAIRDRGWKIRRSDLLKL